MNLPHNTFRSIDTFSPRRGLARFHRLLYAYARTHNLKRVMILVRHMCRYLWAAVAKLDVDWLDGTVTTAILDHPRRRWAARPLGVHTTSVIMAWGGLAVVSQAPLGLLADAKPARVVAQVVLIGFHTANTALFGVSGIGCYSVVMVVSLVIFPCGLVGLPSNSYHQPSSATTTSTPLVPPTRSTPSTFSTRSLPPTRKVGELQKQHDLDRGVRKSRVWESAGEDFNSSTDGPGSELQHRSVRQPTSALQGPGASFIFSGAPRTLPTAVLALLVLQAVLPARQFADGVASLPGWSK